MSLVDSRHPCLEVQDGINFIPNDLSFERGEYSFLVVGSMLTCYNRCRRVPRHHRSEHGRKIVSLLYVACTERRLLIRVSTEHTFDKSE